MVISSTTSTRWPDILYINKELFTYENKEFSERYTALYRDGHSQGSKEDLLGTDFTDLHGLNNSAAEKNNNPCNPRNPCQEKEFKGIPYSEIIDEWWKRNGGVPQEGERNVKLYQLAVNLRAICDNNKSLLLQVMPRLGRRTGIAEHRRVGVQGDTQGYLETYARDYWYE